MGRSKREKYKKNLTQQAYQKLKCMQAYGESKKEAKQNGTDKDKIFSRATFESYWKHIKYFLRYIEVEHPECTTLKAAKKYVNEWLTSRADQVREDGTHVYSAWTIQMEAAALNKLYQISKDDPGRFQPPMRKREDIRRSRGTAVRDQFFNEKQNEELIAFCKSCGFRRNVLENLRGKDLYSREEVEECLKKALEENDQSMIKACRDALEIFFDQNFFILHHKDKGGKTRVSPIIGPGKKKVIARMQRIDPDAKVWQHVNSFCDVHGYRSDYATELYKMYARPIEQLRFDRKIMCADGQMRSEIYACRGSEKGKKLDRVAVHIISVALGHNREDTAITSYIRNI